MYRSGVHACVRLVGRSVWVVRPTDLQHSMLMRWLFALLLIGLAGCSQEAWFTKEFVGVSATHGKYSRGVFPNELLEALDGVAHLLYADGFYFETNGNDFRPKRVFSESSSFGVHYSGTTGKRLSKDFSSQTSFVIIEAPRSEIRCDIQYTSEKEVWISFGQSHVTSVAKPTFFISPERRLQIDQLAGRLSVYLRKKSPGYRVIVSTSPMA
jgi:hypothetical protein